MYLKYSDHMCCSAGFFKRGLASFDVCVENRVVSFSRRVRIKMFYLVYFVYAGNECKACRDWNNVL
jgi:hypothetical protein